jgi:ribosomal protein L7Ae-like RNA K-turn-binding protein
MDDAARRKLANLLGLGVRGRMVVIGVDQVRMAATKNKLVFALVAPDAAKNSLDKVVPLLNARRVRYAEALGADELGAAVGRQSTAAVGVVDGKLARGIRALVEGAEAAREPRVESSPNRRKV